MGYTGLHSHQRNANYDMIHAVMPTENLSRWESGKSYTSVTGASIGT